MNIGKINLGVKNLKAADSTTMSNIANTVVILSGLIAVFMAPMPDYWIPMEIKNYILTVSTGLSAFLKGVQKFSTQNDNPNP